MRKKFLMLTLILIIVNLFIYYGMPYLKQFKETDMTTVSDTEKDPTITGFRPVSVNISVESLCISLMTAETYEKCQTAKGCEKTCETEGCKLFGLVYESSLFKKDSCICNCLEENKIKKALSGQ